jgi:hypothetical protein
MQPRCSLADDTENCTERRSTLLFPVAKVKRLPLVDIAINVDKIVTVEDILCPP